MAFTQITVSPMHPILNPDGSMAQGAITFLLSAAMSNNGMLVEPNPIVATLVGGTFSVTLPATDDPNTLPQSAQYVIVEQTTGSANREYSVNLPSNAQGGLVDYTALFPGPNSTEIYDGEGTDQFISYITPADLLDWLQIPANSVTSPQVVINMQRVVDMACSWVQRYVGRPLCPTMYSERHDGWAGSDIILKKGPILDIILCSEWQSSGGPITLVEATPEMNAGNANVIQVDRSTSSIRRAFSGYSWPRTFFPGSRNISVTYTAGFDPVPPDAWLATIEFAAYWWKNTQQTRRETVRGGSDPEATSPLAGLWQGVPYRLTALLDPFKVINIG